MGVAYRIDAAKNTVYITASGKTDASDWIRCFTELKDHEGRKEDMNVLLDFRKHETVLDTKTVLSLADMTATKATLVKWAFVVSRVVALGMANMVSVHLEKKNIHARVFKNEMEAEDWLQ
jgi:hypothetical protein